MTGLWLALGFLTRLPVPVQAANWDRGGHAVPWFPAVGLIVGMIVALADLLFRSLFPPLLASVLDTALWLGLSGALHADGLMDTADAVLSPSTPERRLEIMRDPHTGVFGVVVLVSTLLARIAALDGLLGPARTLALLMAPTLGRAAIVLLVAAFPYGRVSGLGAPLQHGTPPKAVASAAAVPLFLALIFLPLGPILLAIGLSAAWLLGRWLMGKLPGLTGDCYGAACELVETLTLVAAVSLAPRLVVP